MEGKNVNKLLKLINSTLESEILYYYNKNPSSDSISLDTIVKKTSTIELVDLATELKEERDLLKQYIFDYAQSYHRAVFESEKIDSDYEMFHPPNNILKNTQLFAGLFFGLIGYEISRFVGDTAGLNIVFSASGFAFGYFLEKIYNLYTNVFHPTLKIIGTSAYDKKLKNDLKAALIDDNSSQ